MAGRRSYNLGLIYIANSSYINSLQNGALDACRREHYELLIHPRDYRDPAVVVEIADRLAGAKVDGLLLAPPVSDRKAVRTLIESFYIPYVSISRSTVSNRDWAVGTNDRQVSASMTAHLAALGHRRVAFVRGHPDHKAMDQRFEGFMDGVRAHAIQVADTQVAQGDNSFLSGIGCGEALLHGESRPTAIFCANDHMAAG